MAVPLFIQQVLAITIGMIDTMMVSSAGDVRFPMTVSLFSMWILRIFLAYFIVLSEVSFFGITLPGFGMGVIGIWVAMSVDWIFRTILFVPHFICGKWLMMASLAD